MPAIETRIGLGLSRSLSSRRTGGRDDDEVSVPGPLYVTTHLREACCFDRPGESICLFVGEPMVGVTLGTGSNRAIGEEQSSLR